MYKNVFLFFLIFLFAAPATAQEFPRPVGYVNDFANILPSSDKQRMTDLIAELKEKTGAEVAVATMPDIGGEEYTDYANRLYEAWGLGQKGKDNGVLIFLTLKERKIRIEVGYGFEGILPDGKVGGILDEYVVPLLRSDNFGQGLYNATAVVAATIAEDAGVELTGEPAVRPVRRKPPGRRRGGSILGSLLFFLFIFFLFGRRMGFLPWLFLGSMMGGGRGYGGFGGGFGGGGFGGFGGGLSGGGGAGRGF
ncbi:MAG: TPM domain-containing protein [Gemmatimonadota bacterium]|nr:MAG: TPM domain-containing protein [Gemmatimonadota bacterium]